MTSQKYGEYGEYGEETTGEYGEYGEYRKKLLKFRISKKDELEFPSRKHAKLCLRSMQNVQRLQEWTL